MAQFFRGEELIAIAVEYEEAGFSIYTGAAENTDVPSLRVVFRELAEQENIHKQIFLRMVDDWPQAFRDRKTVGEEEHGYIRALVDSEFRRSDAANIQKAVRAPGARDVLWYAIGFEKETLLFFHALANVLGESQQHLLRAILDEEKTHLRRLTALWKST